MIYNIRNLAEYNIKITWLLPTLRFESAAARLRCFHFARQLSEYNVKSHLFIDVKDASRNITNTKNILIITKRLDIDILKLVSIARVQGNPIIIDICDDLLNSKYKSNNNLIHNNILECISQYLSLITVPSAEMKARMESYLSKYKSISRVVIIPDPVESINDVNLSFKFLKENNPLADIGAFPLPENSIRESSSYSAKREKRLIWFGAGESQTSNFGLMSIVPHLRSLKKLQKLYKFTFIIVTNSSDASKYIFDSGLATEFIPWSFESIFTELNRASACLLTTGNDDLSSTKSNNRLLLSLSQGCPVITLNYPNAEEFKDIGIRILGNGIIRYFSEDNCQGNIKNDIKASSHIIERYSINIVTKLFFECLVDIDCLSKARNKDIFSNEKSSILCLIDHLEIDQIKIVSNFAKSISSTVQFASNKKSFSDDELKFFQDESIIPYVFNQSPSNLYTSIDSIVFSEKNDKLVHEALLKIKKRFTQIDLLNISHLSKLTSQSHSPKIKDNLFPNDTLPSNVPGRYFPINFNKYPASGLEWLFVVPIESKNWILGAIAMEIGSRQPSNWSIFYTNKRAAQLPYAQNVFFLHQAICNRYIVSNINSFNESQIYTWYTHPGSDEAKNIPAHLEAFQKCHKVVFACSRFMKLWNQRGLSPDKTVCILGGADEKMFTAHKRIGRVVGLSSSFYERKNPDLLFEITRMMPDVSFRLIGKGWENYARFEEMLRFGNLEYIQAKYHEYPRYYQDVNVFLSTAKLEGGPIPLIEAMMANCFPVASDTGFCPDIIKHGKNGFLFSADNPSVSEVCNLIERGFELSHINIRDTVLDYTWDKFSSSITDLAKK